MSDSLKIHGYTTLMAPEAMNLPYLEALLSWSNLCDTLHVCYSRFPKLDLEVPDGAVEPWADDGALTVLEMFNEEMLGGNLKIVDHVWDPDEPREDGYTKQIARDSAMELAKDNKDSWLAHFDADELLPDDGAPKILQLISEDNKNPMPRRRPFLCTGILELFGGVDKVRFNWANWMKIRMTRNIQELQHGMPLNLNGMPVRGRNPNTGKIISIDNRDDGAGFISSLSLTRPDYNQGLWTVNKNVMNGIFQLRQIPVQHPAWTQVPLMLQNDLLTGTWLFHTSWIDIARKWAMGWHFDNFWSVLSGKQDTYTEKAEQAGRFTHTRIPEADKLEEELQKEMSRPEIREIPGIEVPAVFSRVREWRQEKNIANNIQGIPYD